MDDVKSVGGSCWLEGVGEERTKKNVDRSRRRNHPPQRRQLMLVWGKKKGQKEEQKKDTGSGPPTQLPGLRYFVKLC